MKKIKSETIDTQHKKTKNFLLVLVALGIVGVLAGSFWTAYSKNKEAFKKNVEAAQNDDTQTEVIADQEIKESWASSVERRIQETQSLVAKGITAAEKTFREDANRREEAMNKKLEKITELIKVSQNGMSEKFKKIEAKIDNSERKSKENIAKLALEIKKLKTKQSMIERQAKLSFKSKDKLPPLVIKNGANTQNSKNGSLIDVNNLVKSNLNSSEKPLLPPLMGQKNGVLIKNEPAIDQNKLSFVVEDSVNKSIEKAFPVDKKEEKEEEVLPKQYEIGLGFFSAVTLTGAYAPIFGEATDQTSIPVLLEVDGDMIVSNGFTESIDKCFALGGAVGNPSSNTVDIRLSVIECILPDGKHKIRGKIKGWVIGENGKPGLSGTLIHKSGQYISRFILAGLLESLSSAFVTAATPENTNGPATSVITGGATQGAAQGAQNAFTRLADFYIKLAEKTLPMIEAKAGRHVSVLVQGGTLYEVKEFNSLNIDSLVEAYENREEIGNE